MDRPRMLYWCVWGFMVVLFFGNSGFRQLVSRHYEVRRLRATYAVLQSEHERLTQEWALIQNDPTHAEYLIRKTLGYAKKGEIEYRLERRTPP